MVFLIYIYSGMHLAMIQNKTKKNMSWCVLVGTSANKFRELGIIYLQLSYYICELRKSRCPSPTSFARAQQSFLATEPIKHYLLFFERRICEALFITINLIGLRLRMPRKGMLRSGSRRRRVGQVITRSDIILCPKFAFYVRTFDQFLPIN